MIPANIEFPDARRAIEQMLAAIVNSGVDHECPVCGSEPGDECLSTCWLAFLRDADEPDEGDAIDRILGGHDDDTLSGLVDKHGDRLGDHEERLVNHDDGLDDHTSRINRQALALAELTLAVNELREAAGLAPVQGGLPYIDMDQDHARLTAKVETPPATTTSEDDDIPF